MPFSPDGVSLILGGARSGKSAFAERLCDESRRRKIYLATSQAFDGEMERRIAHHQSRRGPEWQLVEEPLDLAGALAKALNAESFVLVDCLTLWLTNLMMAERDVEAECAAFVEMLSGIGPRRKRVAGFQRSRAGHRASEEDGAGVRDHAGRLHQDIATVAKNVWFVTAGLPQKLK